MHHFIKFTLLMITMCFTMPAIADKSKSLLKLSRKLGISNDDLRPEQQKQSTLLGKPIIIGGELRNVINAEKDYDLELDAKDDVFSYEPNATLEVFWLTSEDTAIFASMRASFESTIYSEDGNGDTAFDLAIRNLWLLSTNIADTPFAIQVGRQRMQDDREWWWDEHLDAARIHYFGSSINAFVGVGMLNDPISTSSQNRIDPEDRNLLNIFGKVDWKWAKRQHIELFSLHQNDKSKRYSAGEIIRRGSDDDQDAQLTWVGVRASGCIKKSVCYWGDAAHMRGSEVKYDLDGFDRNNRIVDDAARRKLRGSAYDVGLTVKLPLSFKPHLTISQAKGSGDRPRTPGKDGAFRQSGLHGNEGKFQGNNRFRYYGEVLRPNLSNIEINTLAVGIPFKKHGWVETLWHQYRQDYADNRISGSRINENPNGNNKKLGEEVDIIISYRPASPWELELTAGAFRAGSAFEGDAGRWAKLMRFRVDYNF